MPAILGHIPSESERIAMHDNELLLSLPSARLTDKLPPDIRYEIDRLIAAAALSQILKFRRAFASNGRYVKCWSSEKFIKEYIHPTLETLRMPFHDELKPKPKQKLLPLWVEALDLLQSESASKLLDTYREERDDDDDSDWNWSPRRSPRSGCSEASIDARARYHARRENLLAAALLAELERLHGKSRAAVRISLVDVAR